jgi:hypothetical protein
MKLAIFLALSLCACTNGPDGNHPMKCIDGVVYEKRGGYWEMKDASPAHLGLPVACKSVDSTPQ